MPENVAQLGQKVKAKYPGQYDDLDDAEVGRKVKAKFPGAYDDFTDLPTDNSAILQSQAAKYPTSQERGGTAGQATIASKASIVGDAFRNPTVGLQNPIDTSGEAPASIPQVNAIGLDNNWLIQGASVGGPGAVWSGARQIPSMISAAPDVQAARYVLGKIKAPDSRMLRAAALRSGETGLTGVAGDILGMVRGHPAAIVAGKAVRNIGQPYRNVKAKLHERVARFITAGDKPLDFIGSPTRFQGEAQPSRAVPPPIAVGKDPVAGIPAEAGGPTRIRGVEHRPLQVAEPEVPPPTRQITSPVPYQQPVSRVEDVRRLRESAMAADESPFAAGAVKPPAEAGAPLPANIPPPQELMTGGAGAVAQRRWIATNEALGQNKALSPEFIEELHRAAPEIGQLRKGKAFDKALFGSFKRVEENVIRADKTVAPSVTVPNSEIGTAFESLAQKFDANGWPKSANAIRKEAQTWAELPADIPWPIFSNLKKKFLRETSHASSSMRAAYSDVLKPIGEKYANSDALKQANRDYSTVRTAMDAAGINLKHGYRNKMSKNLTPEGTTVEKVKGLRGGPL